MKKLLQRACSFVTVAGFATRDNIACEVASSATERDSVISLRLPESQRNAAVVALATVENPSCLPLFQGMRTHCSSPLDLTFPFSCKLALWKEPAIREVSLLYTHLVGKVISALVSLYGHSAFCRASTRHFITMLEILRAVSAVLFSFSIGMALFVGCRIFTVAPWIAPVQNSPFGIPCSTYPRTFLIVPLVVQSFSFVRLPIFSRSLFNLFCVTATVTLTVGATFSAMFGVASGIRCTLPLPLFLGHGAILTCHQVQ